MKLFLVLFLGLGVFGWHFTALASASEECNTSSPYSPMSSVKDAGARGDGLTNDSAAIQSVVDKVAGTGGTVFIPGGVYMVDAVKGIRLGSDMTLRLSRDAVIKAVPNGEVGYAIIKIDRVENVTVSGGVLVGDRYEHTGTDGEWGMGLYILGGRNIVIDGVTSKDAWGDGFYVTGLSRNVRFCSVVADNNRRQGLSIISVDGVVVWNSIFKNSNGAQPQSGIDIEPNEGQSVNNVLVRNSIFSRNKGVGLSIYVSDGHAAAVVRNVVLDNNSFVANHSGGVVIHNSDGNRVVGNQFVGNGGSAVRLDKRTKSNFVMRNAVSGVGYIDDRGKNNISENISK